MSKCFFSTIIILAGLGVCSANADDGRRTMLAQKYTLGEYPFVNGKFQNDPAGSFIIENGQVRSRADLEKQSGASYRMKWGTETLENEEVLTLTEVRVTDVKDPATKKLLKTDLWARTSTISGSDLRSTTTCYGVSKVNELGSTKNDMKCMTSTNRACERLLKAYNAADGMNGMSVEDSAKTAQYCSTVLRGYENMAKAFGNESIQVAGRREDVIAGDTARVKKLVDEATGSKAWDPTNIGSKATGEELDKMAKGFVGSIQGMQALNVAIQVCKDSMSDFGAKKASGSGGSPASTNKTAQ